MSSEFLGQSWLKGEKNELSPHIVIMTKRFNDVSYLSEKLREIESKKHFFFFAFFQMSRLVVSEILTQPCINTRVQAIEKWTAVADICRCLHNFNGVLQICAAFNNSAVFRLKNTWARVSKSVIRIFFFTFFFQLSSYQIISFQTRQTVEKLQSLVSSDGRYRNLRDSLHRTDPPCIPYLGMYLSDLNFIEEGTPNFTDNGLLNFAKMRMVCKTVWKIQNFSTIQIFT